jgi:hypothetical protein
MFTMILRQAIGQVWRVELKLNLYLRTSRRHMEELMFNSTHS